MPNVVTDTDSPITDEILLGIEHEIARDFAISATAIFRRNHREVWTIREGKDDPDFWVPTVQNVAGWGELELYVTDGIQYGRALEVMSGRTIRFGTRLVLQ